MDAREITRGLRDHGISDGIARTNPVEGGPVGEARLTNGLIHDTWGGYVSRLVEYWGERGVDLTLDDACSALGIDRNTVRSDASVQFLGKNYGELSYDGYINRIKQRIRHEVEIELYPFAKDLRQKVDDIVAILVADNKDTVGEGKPCADMTSENTEATPVINNPDDTVRIDYKSKADMTSEDIETKTSSEEYCQLKKRRDKISKEYDDLYHNSIMAPTQELRDEFEKQLNALKTERNSVDDGLYDSNTQIYKLCLKRDAEESGLAITLDQFINALYQADVSDNPLSREWGVALIETVDDILYGLSGLDPKETKVPEIYVGKDAFEEFKTRISTHNQIRARVEQHMAFIRPAFKTEITLDNHPLLSGVGEK